MNEFSQATFFDQVFQIQRDSYVNLYKFGTIERDVFFRFIPKRDASVKHTLGCLWYVLQKIRRH